MASPTEAECEARRTAIFKAIGSKTPLWAFLLSVSLTIGIIGTLFGYVLANGNGITVLRVEMKNVTERLAEIREVQHSQDALLRQIDKRTNGG